MFKYMRLVVLFDMFLNPSFKMTTSFANIARICFDSYNSLCFKIIDKANSKFDLKIKEALHINWRKPNLNAQQNHLALTLSL